MRLHFRYPAPPQLGALRSALSGCQQALEGSGEIADLYAARARELELEATLAEHIGTPGFFALARQRHPVGTQPDWERARVLAETWASSAERAAEADAPLYLSDDRNAPESLVCVLLRSIGELGLPVRVSIVAEQASRAATADGVIFVRAGEQLSAGRAEGIAAHEVLGHALPRVRARSHALGLYRVASQGAGEDEEGRAIAIEHRLGWLGAERRWELGARHLGALAVAAGADADEVVRLLVARGSSIETALRLYARIARGGGLCRELTYLPAWQRVQRALDRDPAIDDWLARGRLSVSAAEILRHLETR